jgi:chaperonin GroES
VGDGRLLPDGTRSEIQVQEGDRVLFTTWAGTEIKVAGDELLILREDDILAVMD